MEFVMGMNEKERGMIPAGTRVKLYEGCVTLLEDVEVDADQEWVDKAIKDQEDFERGIGVVGQGSDCKISTEAKASASIPLYENQMMKITINCKSNDFQELNSLLQKFLKDKYYSCQSIGYSPVV